MSTYVMYCTDRRERERERAQDTGTNMYAGMNNVLCKNTYNDHDDHHSHCKDHKHFLHEIKRIQNNHIRCPDTLSGKGSPS